MWELYYSYFTVKSTSTGETDPVAAIGSHIVYFVMLKVLGIAVFFVFSPCIRKFSSCFHFQVILILQHYKYICKNQYTKYLSSKITKIRVKIIFPSCLCFFFLKSRNSITIVLIDMKLGIWTSFGQS